MDHFTIPPPDYTQGFFPAWYARDWKQRNARILGELQPATRDKGYQLLQLASEAGHCLIVTSGFRSLEDQQRLYDNKDANPWPVGKPGGCGHERGRALDVVFMRKDGTSASKAMPASAWEAVGRCGERLGLEWGGRWRNVDLVHFQEKGCPPITAAERAHIAGVLKQRGHGTSAHLQAGAA